MKHAVQQLVLVSWLLTRTGFLFAQTTAPDVLHKPDRTTQAVRVKEVTDAEIFYTEPNTPTTVRKIRKADLWKVVYSDGVADVFNEPKTSQPVTVTPVSQPKVAESRPEKAHKSARAPRERPVRNASVSSTPAADIGTFAGGARALSFGLGLAGSSTTRKNGSNSTTSTANDISLGVQYQKFVRDNVSMGGGIRFNLQSEATTANQSKSSDSSPFFAISGQTRRYLPVADQIAFYGFSSVEIGFASYKASAAGRSETLASTQQFSINAGGGLAYLFGAGWSVDFNAMLLGLTVNRIKPNSPTSKASADLSVTGAGVAPSFSILLTRYF